MGKRRSEVPPHLFAISDKAYRDMILSKYIVINYHNYLPIIGSFIIYFIQSNSSLQSEYAYHVSEITTNLALVHLFLEKA